MLGADDPWHGVLPYDALDTAGLDLLGRLAELLERLDHALSTFRAARTACDWLDALSAAEGERFVQLFLIGMTKHHQGALQMVGDLLATEGAATDPRLYQFASDVDSDQRIELDRMGRIAETVPPPT